MGATLRASEEGLDIVDRARRRKGWTTTSRLWCDRALTSVGTLKRFRQGKAIQQGAFVGICDAVDVKWEEVVDNSPKQPAKKGIDFFAYDDVWVGRDTAIAQLKEKVTGACRVLILVGITGIGKTALAERLVVELREDGWLEEDWRDFLQENFEDETESSDFGSVAARWLEKWGEPVTPEDRKDNQRLLYRLVRRIKENRHLVLMDSLEKILEGNESEGWSSFKDEWWVKFLKSLLSADYCQGRVIITSQDLPKQVQEAATRYQKIWHYEPIIGLEQEEQLQLFEKTGLDVEEDSYNKAYLERIGRAYEGYPLALRVIAGEIGNKPFYGNVAAYWKKHGKEIEEVEKAIEEVETKVIVAGADVQWNLDRFTGRLRRNVKSRLDVTFTRLEKDVKSAYLLLCEASVYRCSVPEEFWLSHLEDWDYEEEERLLALNALRDRFLVEESVEQNQYQLRQHNLVRSASLERLKQLDEEDE